MTVSDGTGFILTKWYVKKGIDDMIANAEQQVLY